MAITHIAECVGQVTRDPPLCSARDKNSRRQNKRDGFQSELDHQADSVCHRDGDTKQEPDLNLEKKGFARIRMRTRGSEQKS